MKVFRVIGFAAVAVGMVAGIGAPIRAEAQPDYLELIDLAEHLERELEAHNWGEVVRMGNTHETGEGRNASVDDLSRYIELQMLDYSKWLDVNTLERVRDVTWYEINVNGGVGELTGIVSLTDGTSLRLYANLVTGNGRWALLRVEG